jgi:hypothetical protein
VQALILGGNGSLSCRDLSPDEVKPHVNKQGSKQETGD